MAVRSSPIEARTIFEKNKQSLRIYWDNICILIANEKSEKDVYKKLAISKELDKMVYNYSTADITNNDLKNIPIIEREF